MKWRKNLATFLNRFFSLLRFFNLLEPGTRVLSVSKIMMWATSLSVVLAVWRGEDVSTLIGVAGAQIAAVGNYVHRRQQRSTRDRTEYDVVSHESDRD